MKTEIQRLKNIEHIANELVRTGGLNKYLPMLREALIPIIDWRKSNCTLEKVRKAGNYGKRFSLTYKKEILVHYRKATNTVDELCELYNVSSASIYQWNKKY